MNILFILIYNGRRLTDSVANTFPADAHYRQHAFAAVSNGTPNCSSNIYKHINPTPTDSTKICKNIEAVKYILQYMIKL